MSKRIAFLVVLICFFPVFLGSQCVGKQCLDNSYCTRICECQLSGQVTTTECPLTFRCDTSNDVCEAAYSETTCEEICNELFANNACGSQRCSVNADCVRVATCTSAANQPFECQLTFDCDAELGVCGSGYGFSDGQLCQTQACGGPGA